MKVFIIDDNLPLAYVLNQWILYKGHESAFEVNPHKVIELVRDGSLDGYDYILLDLLLNGISGMDVYEEIKKRGIESKVVIVSGCDVNTEIFQKAVQAKLPIVTKKFDSEKLVDRLESGKIREWCEELNYMSKIDHHII